MKLIATKNNYKEKENQPDFKLYKKDGEGNVIKESYTKKDGSQGERWKSFGAMWFKIEEGKIKSASISIDEEGIPAPTQSLDEAFPTNSDEIPF